MPPNEPPEIIHATSLWEVQQELISLATLFKNVQADQLNKTLYGVGMILEKHIEKLEEVEDFLNTLNTTN